MKQGAKELFSRINEFTTFIDFTFSLIFIKQGCPGKTKEQTVLEEILFNFSHHPPHSCPMGLINYKDYLLLF